MRSSRLASFRIFSLLLILLLTFFAANMIAYASDEDEGESYEEKARVVRISLLKGEVTIKRQGNTDWESARVNFPLVEGDTLATDRESQLEIQIDARNFVRVASSSMVKILTLRDEGVALSVIEGIASVRLAKFDRDHEYFEIDAPQTTLSAERKGLYRIDAARAGRVRFTVLDGGRARIYSETSGFALRDGRAAELINEGPDAGDWELFAAAPRDSWDNWVDDRERYLAQRMRYDTQYYDSGVWGAEDLDAYGNWSYANDYGWIWRPHVTVINNYNNWAPYRYGSWTWLWPYGWTWIGYEPWGWAPYHYGRWVYYNNYWAWCPRSYYYRNHSWWRPALVAFNFSFGNHVSWYPLSYHHRDPRSRHYNFATPDGTPRFKSPRENQAFQKAVTSVTTGDFGGDGVRFQPASGIMARKIIADAPVNGDLPLKPANVVGQKGSSDINRDERVTVAKPRVKPAIDAPDRPTGAAVRKAGIPLDSELRKARVFGGRESKTMTTDRVVTDGAVESRPTGAVTRPPKTLVIDGTDRSDGIQRGDKGMPRVSRPEPTDGGGVIQRGDPEIKGRPERKVNPDDAGTIDSPGRPSKIEDNSERPAKTDRVVRPQPRERVDTPTPSYEPPVRKYEPPPRSEPAPRPAPVQKYEPPQRSEPAPQRSSPPPKSESAPKSSEPAKVAAPRPSSKEQP
jgi:hypothetical protein